MRILVLVLHFSPLGGLEIFGRNLSHSLARLGHNVEVWSIFESGTGLPDENHHVRYLAPKGRQAMRAYYRTMPYLLALRLARKASKFDLVIGTHPMLSLSLYLASRIKPALRYWVCTYGSDVWGEWPALQRLGLEHASRILTISTYTQEMILKRLPSATVDIFYPSVSDDFLDNESIGREQGSPPVLLTVSRLNRVDAYKGHDMVIRALPQIQQRLGRKVLYRIVGGGNWVECLRQLAEEHGVSTSVEFMGRLDKSGLLAAYRGCDIFIMPSRVEKLADGFITGEGFGIVYIEVAASGKPVVGSNQGGAPEAFRDGLTGIAVNPLSVPELVDAVCALLTDSNMRLRMGRAGRQLVEDSFSMKGFDGRLMALLDKAD